MAKHYRVLVDDNYHYQDEDERYQAGEFDNYSDAIAKCRAIVDECLQEQLQPGMSAEELYSAYTGFGEDPWISETPEHLERFSAWDYARERSREMCPETNGQRHHGEANIERPREEP